MTPTANKRRTLPQRRFAETVAFDHAEGANSIKYIGTIGRFENGDVGEIFLNSMKLGTSSDTNARDAAVAVSLALQYGCPLATIRKALTRDASGQPSGPIGRFLDMIEETPSE